MVVCALRVELYFSQSSSLKDKRRVLKSLLERLRNRYNVSVAEVDKQDAWQTSAIGLAVVGNDGLHVRRSVDEVLRFIERNGTVEVLSVYEESAV